MKKLLTCFLGLFLVVALGGASGPYSGGGPFSGNGGSSSGGSGSGVSSINTVSGAFTFSGGGVSCTGTTCTFNSTSGSNLGTSLSAANPQIAGDATSGFYTSGAAKVDVAVSGVNIMEWGTTGVVIPAFTTAGVVQNTAAGLLTSSASLPVASGGNASVVVTAAPYNASGFIQQTVLTGTVAATTTNIPVASSAGFTVGQIAIFGNCGASGTKNFAGTISAIPDSTHITVASAAVTGALLPATSTSSATGTQFSCLINYPVYTLGTTTLGTTVTSGATSLPLTTSASFKAGQGIKITGGGAAGVDLISTIVSVASNTVVISPGIANAGGVSSGAAIMHDDTTAFQTAINLASYNASVSIEVPDGFYQINGQPQNTGTANAALQIPSIDYYPSSFAVWNNGSVIRLYGNTPAGETQSYLAAKAVPYMSGAIIHSDLNSSQYNLIGAYDANSDLNFTNVLLQINNITFRSYPNPNATMVDCLRVESCQFNNVSFDTGETGSTTQPTHTTSFAWRGPGGQNGGNNVFNNLEILGFYNGSQLGEHTRVEHARYDNVFQPIVVGGALVYGITGTDIQFNGCPHGISVGSIGGTSVPLQLELLNIEHQTSPPGWITNVEDINDPSNRLFGLVTTDDANGNTGNNPPTVTGGANLVVADAVQSPAFPFETTTFSGLSNSHHTSFPNGKMLYCSDCTPTPTCAGTGTGAWAQRLNSAWACNGSGTSAGGTVASSTIGQVPVYTAATTVTGSANFTASSGAVTLGASGVAGSLILNGATSGTSTISVPAVAGTARKFQLPPDNGTNTYVLQTDGTGITTWVPPASGGAGTVTTVSVVTANGVSGSVANATTTPAITLTLGAITPTSVNGLTISTTTGVLTVTNGKTLAATNSLTFSGTDGTTMTFPATSDTVAALGTTETFTKSQRVTPVTDSISTATFTPNFDNSNHHNITLVHASCPCTVANPSTTPVAGQQGQIVLNQSASGGDLVNTWGTNYVFTSGVAPTLSTAASAQDILSYYVVDSTHIRVSLLPANGVVSYTATATPGTGVTSCTCQTGACTNLRGTYQVVGGTGTTGTICGLSWTATPSAYVCTATMNGGSTSFGIGNSVATTTGFNMTAAVSVVGSTFTFNYSCQP